MQKHNGVLLRKYDDPVEGNASVGTAVTVRKTSDNSLANIYDVDDTNSMYKNNPFTTDEFGRYSFYAPNGKYTILFGDGSDSIEIGLIDNIVGNNQVYSRNFRNIADLKAGIDASGASVDLVDLVECDIQWLGYYSQNDGGGNRGIIKAGAHTDDGGSIITLGANLYVEAHLPAIVDTRLFGVKGDFFLDDGVTINTSSTDDAPAIQAACNASLSIIHPKGVNSRLNSYVSLRSNHHLVIDGGIINTHHPEAGPAMYHIGGFDAVQKDNILIEGNGIFQSEAVIPQPEATFTVSQDPGYCPIIHLRACTNSTIDGLKGYKLVMGFGSTINTLASQPNFALVPIAGAVGRNIHIVNCEMSYIAFYSVALNTVRVGSMDGNYCYRSGDSGLHAQFCKDIRITNNHRESPFGKGENLGDGTNGIITQNDVQGMSIENCQNVVCSGNILKGFLAYGIDVKNASQNVLVTGNFISYGQLSAIAVRGGDSLYERCTAITITGNVIKNMGYPHSTFSGWVNHPYRGGIFVNDTYSAFISDNTIIGLNSTYARAPIVCEGVTLTNLGFWASYPVQDRIAYTAIVINNNRVTFPEWRSNYPGAVAGDPLTFEAKNCIGSGIIVNGIWGKIQVNDNSLLSNAFTTDRYTNTVTTAAISIIPSGALSAGEASCQSIEVSDNTITYWMGGGIYVDAGDASFAPNMTVDIGSNSISDLPSYGIYVKQASSHGIVGNIINRVGKNGNTVIRTGIYLDGCVSGVISTCTIRKDATAGKSYSHAITTVNSAVNLIANVMQAGSAGLTSGTGITRGGNDQPSGVYNGTNLSL